MSWRERREQNQITRNFAAKHGIPMKKSRTKEAVIVGFAIALLIFAALVVF